MSELEDPIGRITNKPRRRPMVPSRNTSLVREEVSEDAEAVALLDHSAVGSEITISQQEETSDVPGPVLQNTSVRIEQEINLELRSMCLKEGVTKDTFLEAAYVICTENPALLEQVLKEASRRSKVRKEIGNDRKAQSWSKRLSRWFRMICLYVRLSSGITRATKVLQKY